MTTIIIPLTAARAIGLGYTCPDIGDGVETRCGARGVSITAGRRHLLGIAAKLAELGLARASRRVLAALKVAERGGGS